MLPWLIPVVAVALIGLVVATFMVCRQRRRRRNDSHVTITNSSSSGNKWLYKRNKGRIASPAAETTEDEKTEYFTPFSIAARHVRFMSKSPPAATAAGDDIMTNAADDESDIYAAARKNRHIGTATPPALSLPALSTAIVASPGVMVPPPASMRALAPPSTTVSQQQQLLSQVLLPPALASSSAAFNGSIAAMQPLPVSTVVAVPISTPLCAPPSSMNSTNLVSASSISPPQPVTLSPPPVTKSTNVAINRPVSAFQSVSNTSRSLPVIGANTVLPHVAMDMDTVSDLDSWKSCVDIEPNRLSRAAAAGASGTVSTADKPLVNNISAASATINIDGGDGEFFDEVIDIEDADVFKKYLRFATSDSSVPRLSFTFK